MLVKLFGRARPLRRLEPCHPSNSVEEQPAAGRDELAALASMQQAQDARNDLIHRASGAGWWELAFDSVAVTYRAQRLHWSLPLRRLLGFDGDVVLPGTLDGWASRLHRDERASTLAALAAHLDDRSGDTPFDVECRMGCGDGAWRWFRVRCETERDDHGRPLRTVGAMTLIEPQKQRESELEVALTRFALAREMLSEGIWDVALVNGDPLHAGSVFWWSPQFRRLLGLHSEAEFPNVLASWVERLHPEDCAMTLEKFAAHISDHSGKTPYCVEYRLRDKDGHYRWFRARGETQRTDRGLPLRTVGGLRNIDHEKAAEQLASEHARHQLKLENGVRAIAEIAGNIRHIVRQTDLIALNAAVEAARAGPVGRGFSVIAGEMRELSLKIGSAIDQVSRIHQDLGR